MRVADRLFCGECVEGAMEAARDAALVVVANKLRGLINRGIETAFEAAGVMNRVGEMQVLLRDMLHAAAISCHINTED